MNESNYSSSPALTAFHIFWNPEQMLLAVLEEDSEDNRFKSDLLYFSLNNLRDTNQALISVSPGNSKSPATEKRIILHRDKVRKISRSWIMKIPNSFRNDKIIQCNIKSIKENKEDSGGKFLRFYLDMDITNKNEPDLVDHVQFKVKDEIKWIIETVDDIESVKCKKYIYGYSPRYILNDVVHIAPFRSIKDQIIDSSIITKAKLLSMPPVKSTLSIRPSIEFELCLPSVSQSKSQSKSKSQMHDICLEAIKRLCFFVVEPEYKHLLSDSKSRSDAFKIELLSIRNFVEQHFIRSDNSIFIIRIPGANQDYKILNIDPIYYAPRCIVGLIDPDRHIIFDHSKSEESNDENTRSTCCFEIGVFNVEKLSFEQTNENQYLEEAKKLIIGIYKGETTLPILCKNKKPLLRKTFERSILSTIWKNSLLDELIFDPDLTDSQYGQSQDYLDSASAPFIALGDLLWSDNATELRPLGSWSPAILPMLAHESVSKEFLDELSNKHSNIASGQDLLDAIASILWPEICPPGPGANDITSRAKALLILITNKQALQVISITKVPLLFFCLDIFNTDGNFSVFLRQFKLLRQFIEEDDNVFINTLKYLGLKDNVIQLLPKTIINYYSSYKQNRTAELDSSFLEEFHKSLAEIEEILKEVDEVLKQLSINDLGFFQRAEIRNKLHNILKEVVKSEPENKHFYSFSTKMMEFIKAFNQTENVNGRNIDS